MASHAAAAALKPLSTGDILAGNSSKEVNHQAQGFLAAFYTV